MFLSMCVCCSATAKLISSKAEPSCELQAERCGAMKLLAIIRLFGEKRPNEKGRKQKFAIHMRNKNPFIVTLQTPFLFSVHVFHLRFSASAYREPPPLPQYSVNPHTRRATFISSSSPHMKRSLFLPIFAVFCSHDEFYVLCFYSCFILLAFRCFFCFMFLCLFSLYSSL